MKTTLSKIFQRQLLLSGADRVKIFTHLGKSKADNKPLPILTVLDALGIDSALNCIRAVEGYEREKHLLAVAFAKRVQHLMCDQRSIAALDIAYRHANGQATDRELYVAQDVAWAAANAAEDAATDDAAKAAAWAVDANAAWAAFYARDASENPASERAAQEKLLREMLSSLTA